MATTPRKKAPGRRSARSPKADENRIRKFAVEAARLVSDLHCTDVLLLDVRGKSDVTDYILLASGTSDRQIRAVGDQIESLGSDLGMTRFGRDADQNASWIVVDFVDMVAHIFEPATRSHYDLEMLWGDAPRVPWRRRATAVKTKAGAKVESPDGE
jgi:ribosome-associated protein